MTVSSIHQRLLRRGLPLYRIPLTANHRWLRLQWAYEHRAWQADWRQVVFSDESRFRLRDHDGRIRVRRFAGKRCLPECVIELHSGLTTKVMVWVAISHHRQSNLLRIEVISIATGISVKCYSSKSFPSFKAFLKLSFSRIMHAHMLRGLLETSVQLNTCNVLLDMLNHQICRLLSMSGIWLVCVSLVIHVLQLQKTNVCCAYKQYGNLFHKQTFKICLTPCHVV
ncbi:transposable element Tcb1 transposase [Trichonephila clavipes]|nr:transposable element Tcb1 transposase [Trichonephila clavipes]